MNDVLPPAYAFHTGERLLQESAGVAERMAEIGPRAIRRFMPEQHRAFFPLLRYVIIGALDQTGRPWASILSGASGFVDSPDARHLHIAAQPALQDPLHACLQPGAPLAVLGIEAHTRRRNRANGQIVASETAGLSVTVLESFGNCPKYIQARTATALQRPPEEDAEIEAALTPAMRRMVSEADTFFIASAHPDHNEYGVDVSHRGGKPGFVRITDDGASLLIPDFSGNNLFNTLGNIALNARVGLLFITYAEGDLLHLSGHAEIVFDGSELKSFAGAQRLLRITVDAARLRRHALALGWSEAELSPYLEASGSW